MNLQGMDLISYVQMYTMGYVTALRDFPMSGVAKNELGYIVGYRIDPIKNSENIVCCFPNTANPVIWGKRNDSSVVWTLFLNPSQKERTLGFDITVDGNIRLPTDPKPQIQAADLLAAPSETLAPKTKVIPDWPTKCGKCGAPAIMLFTSFECSNNGCIHFKH